MQRPRAITFLAALELCRAHSQKLGYPCEVLLRQVDEPLLRAASRAPRLALKTHAFILSDAGLSDAGLTATRRGVILSR